jgi:excisionase family DNA binding protein
MNFADAIRKVSADAPASQALGLGEAAVTPVQPAPQAPVSTIGVSIGSPVFPGVEGLGVDPATIPAPASQAVHSGNVVRLELFLTAEQMSGLFKAIMAGQHTVMTAREAAAYLRVSKDTLMKLAEEGEIPGIVIDGRWRFPKPNLDEWLTMQSIGHEETEHVA